MTIDDVAAATHQEFQELRKEMATKAELNKTREELKETRIEILKAIDALDVHLSAYGSHTHEEIAHLQNSVNELDGRVRILEKQQ